MPKCLRLETYFLYNIARFVSKLKALFVYFSCNNSYEIKCTFFPPFSWIFLQLKLKMNRLTTSLVVWIVYNIIYNTAFIIYLKLIFFYNTNILFIVAIEVYLYDFRFKSKNIISCYEVNVFIMHVQIRYLDLWYPIDLV